MNRADGIDSRKWKTDVDEGRIAFANRILRAIPVPDIIPSNKPDNTPFTGAPISDDKSSDSSVGVPSESEGDSIAITDEGPPSSPPPAPKISQPSHPSPLNTSPEGDTSHEGAPAVPTSKNTRKQ